MVRQLKRVGGTVVEVHAVHPSSPQPLQILGLEPLGRVGNRRAGAALIADPRDPLARFVRSILNRDPRTNVDTVDSLAVAPADVHQKPRLRTSIILIVGKLRRNLETLL